MNQPVEGEGAQCEASTEWNTTERRIKKEGKVPSHDHRYLALLLLLSPPPSQTLRGWHTQEQGIKRKKEFSFIFLFFLHIYGAVEIVMS